MQTRQLSQSQNLTHWRPVQRMLVQRDLAGASCSSSGSRRPALVPRLSAMCGRYTARLPPEAMSRVSAAAGESCAGLARWLSGLPAARESCATRPKPPERQVPRSRYPRPRRGYTRQPLSAGAAAPPQSPLKLTGSKRCNVGILSELSRHRGARLGHTRGHRERFLSPGVRRGRGTCVCRSWRVPFLSIQRQARRTPSAGIPQKSASFRQ